jgi:hypothetical protein
MSHALRLLGGKEFLEFQIVGVVEVALGSGF